MRSPPGTGPDGLTDMGAPWLLLAQSLPPLVVSDCPFHALRASEFTTPGDTVITVLKKMSLESERKIVMKNN